MSRFLAYIKQLLSRVLALFLQIKNSLALLAVKYKTLPQKTRLGVKITGVIVALSASAIVWFLYFRNYSLNENVKSVHSVIPASAVSYIEIKNTEKLRDLLTSSQTGKAILQSDEWQNLFLTPQFNDLFSVMHILALKTGIPIVIADIPQWFAGSIGFAVFPDQTRLLVAETNLASRTGIAIASALAPQEQIKSAEQKLPQNQDSSESPVPVVYPTSYESEQTALHNLTVNRIIAGADKNYYFVMLGNFLFVSDSVETLHLSVQEGTSGAGGLFANRLSARQIQDDYGAQDAQALVVVDNKNSLLAPVLSALATQQTSMAVIHAQKDKYARVSIFNPDFQSQGKKEHGRTIKWEGEIPQNFVFSVFSGVSASEVITANQSLDKNWKDYSARVQTLVTAFGINLSDVFSTPGGFAFTFNGMRPYGQTIVPDFSFLYPAKTDSDELLFSVFKHKNKQLKNYQGLSYNTYRLPDSSAYTPSSAFHNGIKYLASNETGLSGFLAAKRGNLPVFSDSGLLDTSEDSPTHIVLNVPAAIGELKAFFLFGAQRSEEYSAKTIEKDITGLFLPFLKVEYIHIALGRDSVQTGVIEISGK